MHASAASYALRSDPRELLFMLALQEQEKELETGDEAALGVKKHMKVKVVTHGNVGTVTV